MSASQKLTQTGRRRIYLLRHGDVSYFQPDGTPVRPNTVPLNDEGRRQAEAMARELGQVPFDRALSSDLLRSMETAEIVLAGRGPEVEVHAELREIQPGRLGDIPDEEIEDAFLKAFSQQHTTRESRFLGGETFGSLWDRVTHSFQQILADTNWQHLLMVTHGGVNRVVLSAALHSDLSSFLGVEQDPCCLNILDVEDSGRCLVRLVNHTPYNPSKIGLHLTTMERLYHEFRGRRS